MTASSAQPAALGAAPASAPDAEAQSAVRQDVGPRPAQGDRSVHRCTDRSPDDVTQSGSERSFGELESEPQLESAPCVRVDNGTAEESWLRRLERAINPALATLRLADGVEMFAAPTGSGWVARKLPEGRYLSLTDEERLILLDLDGTRDALALSRRYCERHGKVGFFVVTNLLTIATNAAMLDGGPADVVWAPLKQRIALRSIAGRMSWLNRTLLYRKIPLSGVGPLIDVAYRRFGRFVLHPIGLLVVAMTCLAGFVRWLGLAHPRPSELSISQLLLVAVLASLSLVIHELGHALAVVHFGRHVNKVGLFIMYGAPGGFVDTGDMWIAPRRQRIAVTVAGPIATLFVGAVISLVAPDGNLVVAALAMSQYLLVAANAMPLLKLDGYYVLMDLLQVANLRERAIPFVTSRFKHKVADAWRTGQLVPRLNRTELILFVYGTAALLWLLMFSIAGLFLLPERLWRMGSDAHAIGTRHVLGPLMGVGVVAVIVLIVLQLWGGRAKFVEIGQLVRRTLDRSHGWAAVALVVGLCLVVGGLLPQLIERRSAASASSWAHGFVIVACVIALRQCLELVPSLRGSRWLLPMTGLLLANLVAAGGEVADWGSSSSAFAGTLRMVAAVGVAVGLIGGGRAMVAAFGADLRAVWIPAVVAVVLLNIPGGPSTIGGVMLGAATVTGVRLLRRPNVVDLTLVDVPAGEDLNDRRRTVHLRRAVASLVESVVVHYGELFGEAERTRLIHALNSAAVEDGWKWWFVADGSFVDRSEGSLTDLAEVWGQSIERIASVAGRECGRRVVDDAIVEAYLTLPVRLARLTDEWLGQSLQPCGCGAVDVAAESMAVRLTLGHLVRVPIRELSQAVGPDAVESVIGVVNAAATHHGWGRWFRSNGQMIDDMPAGRDDVATASELLGLLYARLTVAAGLPLTRATVQHARDTLPWELRATAATLMLPPWADTVTERRVRQRTPAKWPIPTSPPADTSDRLLALAVLTSD